MRYRKLTSCGDYTYGSGGLDFLIDINAVAQAIKTRLQLYTDSFWRDLSDGLPMYQNILASSGSEDNLAAVGNLIQDRIRGTEGVEGIVAFNIQFNPDTRQYLFQTTVQTIYSTTVISGAI